MKKMKIKSQIKKGFKWWISTGKLKKKSVRKKTKDTINEYLELIK